LGRIKSSIFVEFIKKSLLYDYDVVLKELLNIGFVWKFCNLHP